MDAVGNLFVTDGASATIRRIVPATGGVTTPIGMAGVTRLGLGPLPGTLVFPSGVAFGGGQLVIVDENQPAILVAQ